MFLLHSRCPSVRSWLVSLLPYWGAPLRALTVANYIRVWQKPDFLPALETTVTVALIGATLVTAAGAALAYLVGRLHLPRGPLLTAIAASPLGIPGIVLGLGYLWLFVGTPLYGSLLLIVLVLAVKGMPFSLKIISSAQAAVHESQEEAARISGAREDQVFARITFPLLRQVFASVWCLLFVFQTHEVDANILLQGSGTVLSVLTYKEWAYGDIPGAAVGAMVLVLVGTVAVFPLLRIGATTISAAPS